MEDSKTITYYNEHAEEFIENSQAYIDMWKNYL